MGLAERRRARLASRRARRARDGRSGARGSDVEEGALVGRALAEIGQPVSAEQIDDRPGQRLAHRPLPGHQHDTRGDLVGDPQTHAHRAEVVEELDPIVRPEPAAGGVVRME